MPVITCKSCQRLTNTALSSVIDPKTWGKFADTCILAVLKDGTAVKGCAYDKADKLEKRFADERILEQPWKKKE